MPQLDLTSARRALEGARRLTDAVADHLARATARDGRVDVDRLDEIQIEAFRFASHVAALEAADAVLRRAERGGDPTGEGLATMISAEVLSELHEEARMLGASWGIDQATLDATVNTPRLRAFAQDTLAPGRWAALGEDVRAHGGPRDGLDGAHALMRDAFRKFAEEVVRPVAEHVHREDALIPREIIDSVAELGCFGLSIPESYGGLQPDDAPDNLNMCVVTEELSRGSLGVAGSLITRPEILSKALLKGGTEAQKRHWLPSLATGEVLCAVAVTEPDFGSNVAGMKVAASPTEGGWLLNGQKTWCTFAGYADVLMVLARTDPDPSLGHRGLSILLAEKPRFEGHTFAHTQEGGGRVTGRAIDTLGYRGMHSYDVFFEDYFVPASHLLGEEAGLGRGFYYQMEGFAGGRLQTAARATGVMQAALEAALAYGDERKVFGRPIAAFPLTAWKLARMSALTHAARQFTYSTAQLLDTGHGHMEASMVKLWASRMAEWVTREAMQIHGGMGYAEEYAVSRYFVDARVFAIFEGAEEVLALRVVARQLLQRRIDSWEVSS